MKLMVLSKNSLACPLPSPDKDLWTKFTGEKISSSIKEITEGETEDRKEANWGTMVKTGLWHHAGHSADIQSTTGTASGSVLWDPRWSRKQSCQTEEPWRPRPLQKKRHLPKPEDLEFDKEGLLQEVNGMKDGDRVSILFQIALCLHRISKLTMNFSQAKHLWETNSQ